MGDRFDVVIVGAGPAGIAAGVQAAERGLSHVLLERAELANTIHLYGKGKHVMAEPTTLPLQGGLKMEFIAEAREGVLDKWQQAIDTSRVNIERGRGCELVKVAGEKGAFHLTLKDGRELDAGAIVMAIGLSGNPRRFGVPGEDLPFVRYNLLDASEYQDKRCVVVGTGDAGIEDALALVRHDNDVTLINLFEGFPLAKAANRSAIEGAISAGDVKEYTFTSVEKFEEGGIWLNTRDEPFYDFPPPPPSPGGDFFVEADLVIGRIGAMPPRGFLQSLGIEFESEHREAMPRVSDKLESSVPGIYLVGALAGRPLIKQCMNQGYEVIEHIIGNRVSSAELPMLKKILAPLGAPVEEIVERVRKKIAIFECLTEPQIEDLLVNSKIHMCRSGDPIFEAGDFSNTFYTILEGAVELYDPAAFDADDDSSCVRVQAGEFFGEGSLLSGGKRPKSATAVSPSVLIETERGPVYRLHQSIPELADRIDNAATARKLSQILTELPPAEVQKVAEAAKIQRYPAGEVIFEEGDEADGLHVIRRGSVVITRLRDGEAKVINHVREGELLGEVALVRPSMRRSATVRATVLTETILIPTPVLLDAASRFPALRESFQRRSQERMVRDERVLATAGSAELVDFVINKGGKEATDLLVIDESLCIRCDNCEKACGETHSGVIRLDREGGPRYAGTHLPTACQHCENPFCMTDCPPNALRRHPDGEVYILDTCIGCGNCAGYCPYGVIKMKKMGQPRQRSLLMSLMFGYNPSSAPKADPDATEMAVKCDLCRDVPGVREGERTVACVSSCPTGAIVRIHPMDFVEDLLGRQKRERCPSCGRAH